MACWTLYTAFCLHIDGEFLCSLVLADEARLAWQALVNVQECSFLALSSGLGGVCLTGCTFLADGAGRAFAWHRSSYRAEVAFRARLLHYPVLLFRVLSAVLTRRTHLSLTRTCRTELPFWAWILVSVACTQWAVESLRAETAILHGRRE